MSSAGNPLELYEPLDIIGNGSFGVIRKVRRKADGVILARKELNFEKMSERDRKQIVAEVNILKDLSHENIVRYHDRFVDREAGILYILMEYCGGGDLSTVIKQCSRANRTLPEDTIWAYFYQILLALQYCHFPSSKSSEANAPVVDNTKRQQILHRDLKPENVFLDGNNAVKLGDFGLSKALGQANFANTYVGTPYYMSPELMQEKSYDTKSDIWSLGCLIYELCALKPPFHEAKTHNELSILIRNGRIPPLPKGYSLALTQIIKSMLNLNPAMRPSAQQLLQHERIDFARKVIETEKMLSAVKSHKTAVVTRERDLAEREAIFAQKDAEYSAIIADKDSQIQHLTSLISQTDEQIRDAVIAREHELRDAVVKREEEVRNAMAKREEEILSAVRAREDEINEAWKAREEQLRKELNDAVEWVQTRQRELEMEAERLEQIRTTLEMEAEQLSSTKAAFSRRDKTPFGEIKNILTPAAKLKAQRTPQRDSLPNFASLETPITKVSSDLTPYSNRAFLGSAMKGVILTATGEAIATPRPNELTNLIQNSPKVGLNFKKIFDFEDVEEDSAESAYAKNIDRPDSPSDRERPSSSRSRSSSSAGKPVPTRLRRPSIRSSVVPQRPPIPQIATWAAPASTTDMTSFETGQTKLNSAPPTPRYDLNDDENLPSPFLKRLEREANAVISARPNVLAATKVSISGRRRSNGNLLRAMAAVNSANNLNVVSASSSGGNIEKEVQPIS